MQTLLDVVVVGFEMVAAAVSFLSTFCCISNILMMFFSKPLLLLLLDVVVRTYFNSKFAGHVLNFGPLGKVMPPLVIQFDGSSFWMKNIHVGVIDGFEVLAERFDTVVNGFNFCRCVVHSLSF